MGRVIKLKISARGVETDAPSVEDLLEQLRDYFELLEEIEATVSPDGGKAIEWRIVNASKSSPLTFEAEAYPRQHGVNVDTRATAVVTHTATGLRTLQTTAQRPEYFSERAVAKAERIFERAAKGRSITEASFGPDLPEVTLTPVAAQTAAENAQRVLKPPTEKPYKEIGSVEGYFHSVERDGWGRPLLWIRHRLTGDRLKCLVFGDALAQVEEHQIKEVWRNRRLQVFGLIHYRSVGRISQIDAERVRFLRRRDELPDVNDILDEDFTGGLKTEDYLGRLRNGDLS